MFRRLKRELLRQLLGPTPEEEAVEELVRFGQRVRAAATKDIGKAWRDVEAYLQREDVPARRKKVLLEYVLDRDDLPEAIRQRAAALHHTFHIEERVERIGEEAEAYLQEQSEEEEE